MRSIVLARVVARVDLNDVVAALLDDCLDILIYLNSLCFELVL